MKPQLFKRFVVISIALQLLALRSEALLFSPTCNSYIDTISVIFLQARVNPSTGAPIIPQRELRLSFYPERQKMTGSKVETKIHYVLGDKNAPVIYLWNGLGSSSKASYSSYLMDRLNDLGFTIVSMPSTLNQKDTLGFSTYVRPGLSSSDIPDLMRLTLAVENELEVRHGLSQSKRILMGVSMGAFQAGVLLSRPEYENLFDRFVLINPPMDLRYGIERLDRLVDGGNGLSARRQEEVEDVEEQYVVNANASTNPEALSRELSRRQFGERELGYLIGSSMRSSVHGSILSSQLVQNDGVLKKKTSFGKSLEVKSWPIQDYFRKIALPFFEKLYAEKGQVLDLDYELSLWSHLAQAPRPDRVLVLHSMDDFISDPQELPRLNSLPVQKVLTQCGGHVGALPYPLFQTPLKKFLIESLTPPEKE